MPEFPHLKLPYKIEGVAKPSGRGGRTPEYKDRTDANKANRFTHGQYLQESITQLRASWAEIKSKSHEISLTTFKDEEIPIFLRIDTEAFNYDSLQHWGIELISEEEEGYIIGASVDDFRAFQENIASFLNEQGIRKDKAAQIWEIVVDENWRKSLLKGSLKYNWDEIGDDEVLTYKIGISCQIVNDKKYPQRDQFDSEELFQAKVLEYDQHLLQLYIERDELVLEREASIGEIISKFGGTLHDEWDSGIDAVHFKLSISGLGIKYILKQYQYLYEVRLDTSFSLTNDSIDYLNSSELSILPPPKGSPKVCVIDSGIQENHRLIRLAIDTGNSKSYIVGNPDISDNVYYSGHGTKVAGAILYPNKIPTEGTYSLETIIQNARILDENGEISKSKFEPKLIQEIISDFYPSTRIYNLSVSDRYAYIDTHMSPLAASIDTLINEKDILFIISAGNLSKSASAPNIGIEEHLINGENYPSYLDFNTSKISNPGISFFSLTVGSISEESFEDDDQITVAGLDKVSPFSRTGLGLWDSIKPDVVEYGGDFIKNKSAGNTALTLNGLTKPELINSTLHGASLTGIDIGTSFSAPKVSYIISKLQAAHPLEKAQMYRALLIQSARLPMHCFSNPTIKDLKHYGYGIPNVDRALNNTKNRITFIQYGKVGPQKGDIYRIKIPQELRGEQFGFKLLVEITLTFTSKVRLTRKGSHSYLANWLEWRSSKYNENFRSFRNRTIEYLESNLENTSEDNDNSGAIKWVLRENPKYNTAFPINRNNSTAQKSWAIIEPHQFAEEFSLAVIGHVGWDNNLSNEVSYALCVSFETIEGEKEIYELMERAQIQIEQEQELEV